jgi:hypothetical protein
MPIALHHFDTWQAGYGGATVHVYEAGTTTLASLYSDENLTIPVANPQTLASMTADGIDYGKWQAPLYVAVAVELQINSIDETGVVRPPLTTLNGADASEAVVRARDGTRWWPLADVTARVIWAEDFGEIGSSTATNTATLDAAIGAAAAQGGGQVWLPAGEIPFDQIELPLGVILAGQGRGATVLQSQIADKAVTLVGNRSGFRRLTLDGINLVAASVGIFAKAIEEVDFDDCEVKRFETGIHLKGGRRARWRDLYVEGCDKGVRLIGDNDAGGGADGDECRDNSWLGGRVSNCISLGVEIAYEDKPVINNRIDDVGFEDNTGTALKIMGARFTRLDGCWMSGNTINLDLRDDTPLNPAGAPENTTQGFLFANGSIRAGAVNIRDTALDTVFDRVTFDGAVAITLTALTSPIVAKDCVEGPEVSIAGLGTKWLRTRTIDEGASFGITTNATATKAWSVYLDPGQVVYAEAHVVGNQQNGSNTGEYHIAVSAKRAGATLAYDTQTANFTVGSILTGQTSGAKARIIGDSDSGSTGTLTLRDITGEFIDDEIITDALTGSATVNGALSSPTVSLLGSVTSLRTAREDVAGWDATFVANGPELELRVTGAASTTIEWTPNVRVTLS